MRSPRLADLFLTVIELLFVLLALAGIAWWSVPAAMIAAGVFGAAASEWAGHQRRPGDGDPGEVAL